METRILCLDGRRFALGLAWRPQGRRPLDRRLALAEASLLGASHCVQAASQAGFASLPPQTDETGLAPLAACLDPARLAGLAAGHPAKGVLPEHAKSVLPEDAPAEGLASPCQPAGSRMADTDRRDSPDSHGSHGRTGQAGHADPAEQDGGTLPAKPAPPAGLPPRRILMLARLRDEGGRPFVWLLCLAEGAVLAGLGDRCFPNLEEAREALAETAELLCGGPGDAGEAEDSGTIRLETGDPGEAASLLASCLAPVPLASRLAAALAGRGRLVPASRWTSPGPRLAWRLAGLLALAGILAGAAFGLARGLGGPAGPSPSREQALASWRASPEQAFGTPWTRLAEPEAFAREAVRLAYAMPSRPAGWRHEASACSLEPAASASPAGCAVLVRSRYAKTPDARHEGLPAGARFDPKRPGELVLEARAQGIPTLGQPGLWHGFAEAGELSRRLQTLGRAVGAKVQTAFKPRQRRHAPGGSGNPAGSGLDCPWLAGTFTLGKVSAEALPATARELTRIPGLVITSLTLAHGGWHIAGELHGR